MPNHNISKQRRRAKVKQLNRRDGGFCQHCRKPWSAERRPTLDHIHPWAWGGTNALSNLQLLCSPCNRARNRWILQAGWRPGIPAQRSSHSGLLHSDA